MDIRECYEKMQSNYDNVLERLGSEAIVKKFALRFLDEGSYNLLSEAMKAGNVDEAFRAAHTLKGICLNLGFDKLFEVSSALTEKLRTGSMDGAQELFEKVKEQYNVTKEAIEAVK